MHCQTKWVVLLELLILFCWVLELQSVDQVILETDSGNEFQSVMVHGMYH